MYLKFAEAQASRRKTMTMREWEERLDSFLSFNERELLTHAGKVRAEVAERLAHERYEQFDATRKSLDRQQADADDLRTIEALRRRSPPQRPRAQKP